MKPKTISYQKVFALAPYINEKIGIEMDLDDTDSPDAAFEECKRLVEKWGAQEPPQLDIYSALAKRGVQATNVAAPSIDPRAYEAAEIAIDNATTIQDLEFYADIAVKYGLVEMYLAKKKTLE